MRRLVLLSVVVLLGAVGCGSGRTPERDAAPATPVSPPAASSATPSTPTFPIPLVARDGRDHSACATGNCEVLVRGGDRIQWQGNTLWVTVVTPVGAAVEGKFADGSSVRAIVYAGPVWTTAAGIEVVIAGTHDWESVLRITTPPG